MSPFAGRREPFDLIIVEQFNTDCMLGIAHKLKAPVIGLSSCNIMPWHFPRIGLPYEPGFYPTTFIGASDNMSFSSRLSNWFTFVYTNTLYRFLTEPATNKLLSRRFGDDIPDLSVLTKKVSLMFVNQHFSLSGAKHLSPNVIELGGIHIGKANELDPVGMHNIIQKLELYQPNCLGITRSSWHRQGRSDLHKLWVNGSRWNYAGGKTRSDCSRTWQIEAARFLEMGKWHLTKSTSERFYSQVDATARHSL